MAAIQIQNAQGKKIKGTSALQSSDPSVQKKAKGIFQRLKDKFAKGKGKRDFEKQKKAVSKGAADYVRKLDKESVNEISFSHVSTKKLVTTYKQMADERLSAAAALTFRLIAKELKKRKVKLPESVNEKTVSIGGEELMKYLMKRFKMSKSQAIASMKKHKMDMSFLKNESITEDWWSDMSSYDQSQYIKDHPNSDKAKSSKKARKDKQANRKKLAKRGYDIDATTGKAVKKSEKEDPKKKEKHKKAISKGIFPGSPEYSKFMKESTKEYGKTLDKIAKNRQLKSISKKDRDTLIKIAQMMKKANESVNEDINDKMKTTMTKLAKSLGIKSIASMHTGKGSLSYFLDDEKEALKLQKFLQKSFKRVRKINLDKAEGDTANFVVAADMLGLESVSEGAFYDTKSKIKTSIDNDFKKASIKVVKFKPMKKSFYKGLWGGFYYVKSVRGTDTIPVYVEKKGFIDLGVSEKDFWIGKVGSSEVARNLKDFKKTDLDTDLDESVNEVGLEMNKLKDAIKMFQKKIKKQGRVTNARDEEHLKNLIKVYKQMGGKGVKESVNEVSGVDVAKKVLKNKQREKGIDLQTANLIVTIDKAYDKNPKLQKKFRAIQLPKMKQLIMKYYG